MKTTMFEWICKMKNCAISEENKQRIIDWIYCERLMPYEFLVEDEKEDDGEGENVLKIEKGDMPKEIKKYIEDNEFLFDFDDIKPWLEKEIEIPDFDFPKEQMVLFVLK